MYVSLSFWLLSSIAFTATVVTAQSTGDVRLVGGSAPNQGDGRVEIYYDSQWGTVCNDGWGFNDAEVVCHQLGYPGATSSSNPYVGGSGQIWMDNVRCSGSEEALSDCTFNGWGVSDCYHYQDAGVICYGQASGGTKIDVAVIFQTVVIIVGAIISNAI